MPPPMPYDSRHSFLYATLVIVISTITPLSPLAGFTFDTPPHAADY